MWRLEDDEYALGETRENSPAKSTQVEVIDSLELVLSLDFTRERMLTRSSMILEAAHGFHQQPAKVKETEMTRARRCRARTSLVKSYEQNSDL